MAGRTRLIDSQVALDATPTVVAIGDNRVGAKATCFVSRIALAAGTTWTADFQWKDEEGNFVTVASATVPGSASKAVIEAAKASIESSRQAIERGALIETYDCDCEHPVAGKCPTTGLYQLADNKGTPT